MKKYTVWIMFTDHFDIAKLTCVIPAENRVQAEWFVEQLFRNDPTLVSVQVRDSEE